MLSRFKYYPGHAGFPQPIFNLMKPRILEISKIQGYGRHTEEEVIKIAKSDLKVFFLYCVIEMKMKEIIVFY